MESIIINRNTSEEFCFPVDKIAYVKFNDYERKITVAPVGAEAIFFNIPYYKRNIHDALRAIDEYDEVKKKILTALKKE